VCLFSALWAGMGSSPAAENKPRYYLMSQLNEAKKRAQSEQKPIAWIATQPDFLTPHPKPKGKGSHPATTYALIALEKETVIVVSDTNKENHQEPGIVDQALHTPDPHYNVPGVVILTPALDKVICEADYKADAKERVAVYTEVLKKIRDKTAWAQKP
jgi:hypothetical protein